MFNRKAILIVLSLTTILLCVVVWQTVYRGTPVCIYSRLRTDANQGALNGDFSRALTAENLAIGNLDSVESDLRERAKEESLIRLATFALASGDVVTSIDCRRKLIAMLREQGNRSYSILLHEKLLGITNLVSDLDSTAQAAVSAGTAAQFQADLYFRNEQPYQAIERLNAAAEKFNSVFGENHILTALMSGRWIDLRLRYGGLPGALDKIDKIRSLLTSQLGASHPETIGLLTVEATHFEVQAQWQPYAKCYKSYLDELTKIDPHNKQEMIAIAKRQLAFGYSRSIQFDLAGKHYDESEGLVCKLYGEPSFELAQWMFVRADNYTTTGEWKAGESLLEQSLVNLQRLIDNHTGQWNEPTLNHIRRLKSATIHRQALCALYDEKMGKAFKLKRARKAFLEAKAILDELGLQKSLRYVFILRQLCEVEHLSKREFPDSDADETRAKAYIDEAWETYTRLYGNDEGPHFKLLQLHRNATNRAWGNLDDLISEYETSNQLKNSNKAQDAMWLREKGLTYVEMGQPGKAIEAYSNAIDRYGEYFFSHLLASDVSQAGSYAEFSRDCLQDMFAAADKSDPIQVTKLFENVSRIKGMVARLQAMRSQVITRLDESTRDELSRKLAEVGSGIFNLSIEKAKRRDSSPGIENQLKKLAREKREVVARIASMISFEDIQFESSIIPRLENELPVNTIVVEFYRQAENQIDDKNIYYALVFKRLENDHALSCVTLDDAEEIDELVVRLNEFVRQSTRGVPVDAEFSSIANRLREKTWDRIQPNLENADAIILCGDGKLSAVPWSGLPSKSNPERYLLEDFLIVPATSSRDLVDNLAANRCLGEGSLLVGNPDFGSNEQTVPATSLFTFPRLQESIIEIKTLTPLLGEVGDTHILQDQDVTLEKITERLSNVRVAHFATHGVFLDAPKDGVKDHPFAQAALALSNANEPLTTGDECRFLSAEQIVAMNLTNLDLVVLSACESSCGIELKGEGDFGMQRALFLAGAKSCVASQWPVGDAEARIFMELFYKNLLEHKLSKINALRQAQIQMYRKGYSPESWANWKLLGDWR